ncbi:MAG: hypothetical protein WDA25_00345 [Paracoccaceae bacterium]
MRRLAILLMLGLVACGPPQPGGEIDLAPGEMPAFGEVARVCGLSDADLGHEVDRFPREGRPVWRMYDVAPDATAPRAKYITGFADGCARQVSASVALFGSPLVHESHRYSDAMADIPYSHAATAYEAIKSGICGVGRSTPCPPARMGAVERAVAFVSVYHRFGDTDRWLELLLHDGRIVTRELH